MAELHLTLSEEERDLSGESFGASFEGYARRRRADGCERGLRDCVNQPPERTGAVCRDSGVNQQRFLAPDSRILTSRATRRPLSRPGCSAILKGSG